MKPLTLVSVVLLVSLPMIAAGQTNADALQRLSIFNQHRGDVPATTRGGSGEVQQSPHYFYIGWFHENSKLTAILEFARQGSPSSSQAVNEGDVLTDGSRIIQVTPDMVLISLNGRTTRLPLGRELDRAMPATPPGQRSSTEQRMVPRGFMPSTGPARSTN